MLRQEESALGSSQPTAVRYVQCCMRPESTYIHTCWEDHVECELILNCMWVVERRVARLHGKYEDLRAKRSYVLYVSTVSRGSRFDVHLSFPLLPYCTVRPVLTVERSRTLRSVHIALRNVKFCPPLTVTSAFHR